MNQLLMETIAQTVISFTSLAAVWMITREEAWAKWGYLIGIAGQPFWLYSTFEHGQYGMLFASALYTWFWLHSIWKEWFA